MKNMLRMIKVLYGATIALLEPYSLNRYPSRNSRKKLSKGNYRINFIQVATLTACSVIVTTSHSLDARSLSTGDFAYGLTLNLSGDGSIHRLALPEAVYMGAVRQDLGDIRIFNGSGEIVPHSLCSSMAGPEGGSSDKENGITTMHSGDVKRDLNFFPLYSDNQGLKDNDLSMSIRQSADGTIIHVDSSRQRDGSTRETENRDAQNSSDRDPDGTERQPGGSASQQGSSGVESNITGYLLDMGKIRPYPVALEVEWSGGGDHFVIEVTLQGSDDLTYWHHITEKSLAELKFAGNKIYENHLPLENLKKHHSYLHRRGSEERGAEDKRGYRYLRLSWPAGEDGSTSGAELSRVTAILPEPELKIRREWRELSNGRFNQTNRMVIDFDSGGLFPIEALQIRFQQTNSIIRAEIQSAHDHNSQWHHRCEGVFYTLRAGRSAKSHDSESAALFGHSEMRELSNGILTFPPTSDRAWRIRVSQDGAGLSDALSPPALQVGWRADEILFVSRGAPPYTLAYGSAALLEQNSGSQAIPEAILKRVHREDILTATHGAPRILGGDGALKLPPPPLPWKKWILWGVLICGLCLLAFMVWRLASQMGRRE